MLLLTGRGLVSYFHVFIVSLEVSEQLNLRMSSRFYTLKASYKKLSMLSYTKDS